MRIGTAAIYPMELQCPACLRQVIVLAIYFRLFSVSLSKLRSLFTYLYNTRHIDLFRTNILLCICFMFHQKTRKYSYTCFYMFSRGTQT